MSFFGKNDLLKKLVISFIKVICLTRKKDIFLLYFLLTLELLILINSSLIIKSVKDSSFMFIIKIFPSLFPTMVIGNLLIKNNIELIIPKFIKKIFNKLFNFNDIETSIFIISIFTGTPSNAIYINEYLEKNLITKKEAEALLCTTHFINPLFVVAGVGIGVFNDVKIGFLLLFLIWTSNLFKAFLNRNDFGQMNKRNITLNEKSFITTISESIKISINALLVIFGIVIMFNLLVALITNIFNLNQFTNTIINGLLEMTGGIMKLSSLDIDIYLKIILAYIFLNFGGICIQMQTFSMFNNKKIRYLKYLIFRLI